MARDQPPSNPHAFAVRQGRLLALPPNERRALGLRARERIQRDYPISKMLSSYAELFELVVGADHFELLEGRRIAASGGHQSDPGSQLGCQAMTEERRARVTSLWREDEVV